MKRKKNSYKYSYRWGWITVFALIVILLCTLIYKFVFDDDSSATVSSNINAPVESMAPPPEMVNANGVMVLNYHKIENRLLSLAVRVNDFDKHMMWLKEAGYTSITPEQLYDFVSKGTPLPPKPVLITFDDGYVDNYTNAYPILKRYGFVATVFVVTGFLDKYPEHLTWAQAKEMLDNGFSIESHTVNHKPMTELSDEQLRNELIESRKQISDKLGKESFFVAYPTGTYNLHIAQMVKEAGYKAAFTIKYDNVGMNSNVYALERVPIFQTETTNHDFLERINYIPIFEKFGWVKN